MAGYQTKQKGLRKMFQTTRAYFLFFLPVTTSFAHFPPFSLDTTQGVMLKSLSGYLLSLPLRLLVNPCVAKLGVTSSETWTTLLPRSYSQNGLESESRSCMAVIDCCKALGVNHSFGKQRCRKGTQELKWASRLTQLGISCPQRICVTDPEKWLQLLFIRWYRSPRNWLPSSSTIRRTSSSVKSVQPI